jgi:hypothetical protein
MIEMKNKKKKRKNNIKLNTNIWPQLCNPMCITKNGLSLHQHSSWKLLLVQQPRTLDQGLPKPQTSLQAMPFLWPMGTLENALPPGSGPTGLSPETPYHELLE